LVNNDGYELPSRDAPWNKVLYGILALLVVVAIGVFLDVAGIFPTGQFIPGAPSTFDSTGEAMAGDGARGPEGTPGQGKQAGAAAADSEGSEESGTDSGVEQILKVAEESIANNRLQTAIEKLQGAKALDPKHAETYAMLADVYKKLGQKDKAEKNRKKAEELRGGDGGGSEAKQKEGEAAAKQKGEEAADEGSE
jgi:tetratricopeptide (TPR) repeat protein